MLNHSLVPVGSTGYDIPYSARFNDDDSAYLSRTFASAGNRRTFTLSMWFKLGNLGVAQKLWTVGADSSNKTEIEIGSSGIIWVEDKASGSAQATFQSTQLLRDTSAWYHLIVAVDTTQGTAANRVKIYLNGNQVTDFTTYETYPDQNDDWSTNTAAAHYLGKRSYSSNYYDGYLGEVNFIDGSAKVPADFGETGDYGEWKPIEYAGSYGTNGFYLDFSNSGTKHTLTANGNAQHSTAQSKIGSSSMVFDGAGDYVSVSNPSDIKGLGDFTIECWVRPDATSFSGSRFIMGNGSGQDITATIGFMQKGSDGKVYFHGYIGSTAYHPEYSNTVGVSVSTTAWTHVSAVRSGGTITVYKDGVSQGTISNSSAVSTPSSNAYSIGRLGSYNGGYYDGYLDEIRISNNARYTSGFTPSTTAFTDDDNTLLLVHSDTSNGSTTFTDSSGVTGALGNDQSGEANHWTPNNLAATDQMLDSPTNNFCTMNPLAGVSGNTFTEGNTQVLCSSSGSLGTTLSTMNFTSGKWYAEFYLKVMDTRGQQLGITGDSQDHSNGSNWIGQYSDSYIFYGDGTASRKYNNNSQTSYGANWAAGDIIGVAVDLDSATSTITFYHNGSSQGTAYSSLSGTSWVFTYGDASTNINLSEFVVNFGQDSSFAGNKTAQGNQDSNSIGDFYYTPPTDFLALCTSNLPDPAVIPSEHFNTILWSGDNNATRSLTGVGFQPDLIWLKVRSNATVYHIQDAVRTFGIDKTIGSDTTSAEPLSDSTNYGSVGSVGSDGFTVAAGSASGYTLHQINLSGRTYVAWNWKAGNATLGTGDFTQGTIASTCSRNVDAGFSIVSYTGNGSGGSTVGHGLSSAPEMVIIKNRDDGTRSWQVYHSALGGTNYIFLDTTGATGTSVGPWSNTDTTNTLITLGTWPELNQSGSAHIAYCFHSVAQYSKVFSYTGNGSTDGTFVYCDFRPKYVMLKASSISGEHWWLFDTERDTYNVMNSRLAASESAEEKYTVDFIDVTSNGFKLRTSSVMANSNGATYIGIAFAELPAKYNNAR